MAGSFYMPIAGATNFLGRGVVVSGVISSGSVQVGDVLRLSTGALCRVKSIMFENKMRPGAAAGETVFLLVQGEGFKLKAADIPQGASLASDGGASGGAPSPAEKEEPVYDVD